MPYLLKTWYHFAAILCCTQNYREGRDPDKNKSERHKVSLSLFTGVNYGDRTHGLQGHNLAL